MRGTRKIYISIASVLVAVGAMVMLNVTGTTTKAETRDCEADTIIQCGALTQSELVQKYDANATGDIQAVFSHYGISRSDLTGETSQIKVGTVYRDGRVVVNGETVATGAFSVSRLRFSNASRAVTIAGKTFYEGPDMSIFVRDVQAYVMFRNGQFYRAVLISCGNPLMATPTKPPVQPSYSCDSLKAVKVDRDKYEFTVAASAKDGARIAHYTFDFGDGNTQTVSSTTTVSHTYAKPGTYTATVTVNVKVGDNDERKDVTSENCKVTVEVKPVPVTPSAVCNSLKAEEVDRTTFKFTTSATAEGGAEIVNYTYDFGDTQTKTTTDTSVTHTYAQPGTYNVKVSVNVKINGENKVITSENCQTTVKVEKTPPTPFYACDSLKATKINRTTFQFKTIATVEGGAEVVNYTYDFGDSHTETVDTDTISHTYTKPGTYTVKVTVNVKVNGETKPVTSEKCQTTVTVEKVPVTPMYACDNLTIKPVENKENTYAYTLTYTAEGGATLKKVVYDFGDTNTATYSAAEATNVEHTYDTAGTYKTVATLYFDVVNGETTSEKTVTCEVSITITPPEVCVGPNGETFPKGSSECEEQPEVCTAPNGKTYPMGSSECAPVPTPPETPPQTPPTAQIPKELPTTGLTGSLLSGGLGLSSLTAAGYCWAVSRKSLLSALLNR